MSFFNKVLASVGIGAATVDTKLQYTTYRAGEIINGIVEIRGGNAEQQIDTIYLNLYANYSKEVNGSKRNETAVLKRLRLNEAFTIRANELHNIPLSFELPIDVPVTLGQTRVWIHTGLDIKAAIDPTDKDYIEIKPTPLATQILQAVEQLGFHLRKVDCEATSTRYQQNYPFLQEFEFVPTANIYRGRLDELEVIFLSQSAHSAEILLQVDRKVRGLASLLSEALDMDESFVRLTIFADDSIQAKIQQAINKHM
ncbi:sporulation protein [Metasolibacillus meyeri]|uniref:sporulation protein n=1 Tax=Metasolibacillus meyeri TaxID=1071052 RepID=UPI000D30EB10|nr:sporulation protein [Metasolibacillus meyeri]